MMDPHARSSDTSLLHKTFSDVLLGKLVPALAAASIPLAPFEAFRAPERQADLFKIGRVTGVGQLGHHVTWDLAWQSKHQYGLAVDMVFHVNGQWTWNEPSPGMWKKYQEIAASFGLQPVKDKAGNILEWPHCQLSWPTVQLLAGEYPPGGGETWASNLNATIARWGSKPVVLNGYEHPGSPK